MKPMPSNNLAEHCRGIARRFLLTALVVDDEPSVPQDPPAHGGLREPDGSAAKPAPESVDPPSHPPRPLKLNPITWSFARQGMVCGVVSPREGKSDDEAIAKAAARADIVILDWRLSRKRGENALPLLERILGEDRANRLRLIAFYTGEPDHNVIYCKIRDMLQGLDLPDVEVSTEEDQSTIDFGACRIILYAKPDSQIPNKNVIVKEEDLADRLIGDFTDIVEGLLPSLVLTALTAVRENVYRVLERFGSDLDPAFLAHRACLPQPQESEQHIVEQIASELHGIMDDAVSGTNPAGLEAIEHWLRDRFENNCIVFDPGKELSYGDVLAMLEHGVERKHGSLKKDGKDYSILSQGFLLDSKCNHRELDRRLASAMSFRQVLGGTERQLSMGTVIRRIGEESATLLCVTPRCDSVRLTEETSFLFLPLTDPKSKTPQVVIPISKNKHKRMTISMKPSDWRKLEFKPDCKRQCVLARCGGADKSFKFKDVSGGEYQWIGELKAEFAQSIAQLIAERMSRIPLNKSEWLRRSERVGIRND